MNQVPVTCAVIFEDQKVLCALRSARMPQPGFWEFPGGKVEDNESFLECLLREIKEELTIDIEILWPLSPVVYSYTEDKVVKLFPFVCSWTVQEISLLEHQKIRWVGKEELLHLNWAPADLPIVIEVVENWGFIQKKLGN